MTKDNANKTLIITASVLAAGIAAISFLLLSPLPATISCLLGWAMLAIAISDARYFIVPDIISLPAIPAGLLAIWVLAPATNAPQALLQHLLAASFAAMAFYAIRWAYYAVRKQEGLGLGDVKLATIAGAWTGIQGSLWVILLACLAAFSVIIIQYALGSRALTRTTALPFGAFLAPAIWLIWVLGVMMVLPTVI